MDYLRFNGPACSLKFNSTVKNQDNIDGCKGMSLVLIDGDNGQSFSQTVHVRIYDQISRPQCLPNQ